MGENLNKRNFPVFSITRLYLETKSKLKIIKNIKSQRGEETSEIETTRRGTRVVKVREDWNELLNSQ